MTRVQSREDIRNCDLDSNEMNLKIQKGKGNQGEAPPAISPQLLAAYNRMNSPMASGFASSSYHGKTPARKNNYALAKSWSGVDGVKANGKTGGSPYPTGEDLRPLGWLWKSSIGLVEISPLDTDDRLQNREEIVVATNGSSKAIMGPSSSASHRKLPSVNFQNPYNMQAGGAGHGHQMMEQGGLMNGMEGVRRFPKPSYSYTHLIFMAIESTLHKSMTVNAIYQWCEAHFPYFKTAGAGWKNSLRHNLSINKSFKRIPRDGRDDSESDDDMDDDLEGPGRGAFWTCDPNERAGLLEAVKRNPWNLRSSVNNGSMVMQQGYVQGVGQGAIMQPSPSMCGPSSGQSSGSFSTEDNSEDDDVKYRRMLSGLIPIDSAEAYRKTQAPHGAERRKINGIRQHTVAPELKNIRLPSRTTMPLLHDTMERIFLADLRAARSSGHTMSSAELQAVRDLVDLLNQVNSQDFASCPDCRESKENAGCESCRNMRSIPKKPQGFIPSPYPDHDYAMFQSAMRPSMDEGYDLENSEDEEEDDDDKTVAMEIDDWSENDFEEEEEESEASEPEDITNDEDHKAAEILMRFKRKTGYISEDSSPTK